MKRLSVEDALSFGGLKDAIVVAGREGLKNYVDSISLLEVAEHQISQCVKDNELYITSFYAVRDNVEMQKIIIETLAQCNCCGLVICHLDSCLKKIDPEIIALCDRITFPLIVANSSTSYVNILNPLIGKLMYFKGNADEFAKIRADFLDIIIQENHISDALKKISCRVDYEISYFDIYLHCLYSNKIEKEVEQEQQFLKENISAIKTELQKQAHIIKKISDISKVIYPISAINRLFGYFIINPDKHYSLEKTLKETKELCLPCSLIFSHQAHIMDLKGIYEREYLEDLILWNFQSEEMAVLKGAEVGFDIRDKHYMLLIKINDYQQEDPAKENRILTNYIVKWFVPRLSEIVRSYCLTGIICHRSDIIFVLLSECEKDPGFKQLAGRLVSLFEADHKISVSVAISSRFEGIREIPNIYNQTLQAAMISHEYFDKNKAVSNDDVWFYQILLALRKDHDALDFSRKMLDPLIRQDEQSGTELLKTLKVIFDCSMDISMAADKMFVHRNTILYRKNKIIKILGLNPFESPYLISFLAALNILKT